MNKDDAIHKDKKAKFRAFAEDKGVNTIPLLVLTKKFTQEDIDSSNFRPSTDDIKLALTLVKTNHYPQDSLKSFA